jgi:hypothetical protein
MRSWIVAAASFGALALALPSRAAACSTRPGRKIEKGEKNSMHDHPSGVQILLTDAHLRQTTPDGKTSEVSGKAPATASR